MPTANVDWTILLPVILALGIFGAGFFMMVTGVWAARNR